MMGAGAESTGYPVDATLAPKVIKSTLDHHDADCDTVGQSQRSGREIIQIQVGKAGCGMGHEFIRDLVEEHQVNYLNEDLRGTFTGTNEMLEQHLDVFFNEGASTGSRHRWVPRCILVDLNMQDLAQRTSEPLGFLYRPENIVGNDEGSGNNYAKAFHTEGPDVADLVLDLVRKEAERCNSLQGVQFVNSISGGTGSGLTGLMMKALRDYLDMHSKCLMQSFTLVPAEGICDITLEPYNACLGLQDLVEYCDQCFFYDNNALTNICQKSRGSRVPKTTELNDIVAWCMSGLTSGLRFKGPLNADLWKMHSNLVPFKNCHFLISSFAPLNAPGAEVYRQEGNVLDLAQQMLMKENVTCSCDPLNVGDPRNEIPRARILASWASWRGDFRTQEVDRILYSMWKSGSRFDSYYPDWIPNPIASNVCMQPRMDEQGRAVNAVVYVANNTAVTQVLTHTMEAWDRMFKKGSYLHVFESNGISRDDMQESKKIVQYVKEQYDAYGVKEDKILDEAGGRMNINYNAIENDEQDRIAKELMMLTSEDQYITTTKAR